MVLLNKNLNKKLYLYHIRFVISLLRSKVMERECIKEEMCPELYAVMRMADLDEIFWMKLTDLTNFEKV